MLPPWSACVLGAWLMRWCSWAAPTMPEPWRPLLARDSTWFSTAYVVRPCSRPLRPRAGARILTIGTGAGREINFNIADLLFRTLSCVGTGQRPASDRQATWRRLLRMAREHRITSDHIGYRFDQSPDAWAGQVAGPHAKITATIGA